MQFARGFYLINILIGGQGKRNRIPIKLALCLQSHLMFYHQLLYYKRRETKITKDPVQLRELKVWGKKKEKKEKG